MLSILEPRSNARLVNSRASFMSRECQQLSDPTDISRMQASTPVLLPPCGAHPPGGKPWLFVEPFCRAESVGEKHAVMLVRTSPVSARATSVEFHCEDVCNKFVKQHHARCCMPNYELVQIFREPNNNAVESIARLCHAESDSYTRGKVC